ncbi:MAG: flavin reductase family protein [Chloroflexi bacterium]|nr:flavin reductase family protein [Chloroflexota bacterium]
MTAAPEALRETMRQWTSGIVVVTTALGDRRAGVTVSSFTSVSLEPPLVLICLQKTILPLQLVRESGIFAASMLREGQADVSAQFAGFTPLPEGADRFYGIETFYAVTGAPVLVDALAWVDCRVHAIYDGGGSDIVVGKVLATAHRPDVLPLAYHNRQYYSLAPSP